MTRLLHIALAAPAAGLCCFLASGRLDPPAAEHEEAPPALVETLEPEADELGRSLSSLDGPAFEESYLQHARQIVRARQRTAGGYELAERRPSERTCPRADR